MPIKYRLVLRKDMTKGAAAGSKLYYAVNKSTGTCDFEELCDQMVAPVRVKQTTKLSARELDVLSCGATCRSW